ncbi:hypothetical protein [Brevibacillus fortis]|uniref:Uncharacterized protein n=1 Tax=Brevibacillus fortis TaxID=2126352 RepID=A0A2P7VJ42_9BACL|nr:hypothetical protein [Brevibacillus fortis]PSJ99238.1 hypothetical protein C7R93_05090 [Brevibacillus fortis]
MKNVLKNRMAKLLLSVSIAAGVLSFGLTPASAFSLEEAMMQVQKARGKSLAQKREEAFNSMRGFMDKMDRSKRDITQRVTR